MRVQIVGKGRMGTALDHALRAAGAEVLPLAGREAGGAGSVGDGGGSPDVVLLAVPDAAIAEAAARIPAKPASAGGPLVGHLSGATPLAPLEPHEAFSLHPLLSATGPGTRFEGAWAAVDGTSDRAREAAEGLAALLGLRTFRVNDADRAAYHAAASIAANFLVVLEGAAEQLAATAGVPREALAPLAAGALANWERLGAERALTGPVARGDEATIARQRKAVAERIPSSLSLYDAMVAASRDLAARGGSTALPSESGQTGSPATEEST
ncbi:DUF2520 domain-containing protein [Leucobacter sp. USHLN153]|uniref:DUF2520 domain-containing protein n=1 Tax=Leucobacter sp. USHLN153 TaxID=3081268 RepID=UPI00301855C6